MTRAARAAAQRDWSPWSEFAPTEGPYDGVNAGPVTIRTLGGRAMLDRGEIVHRDTFTVAIRSVRTGRTAVYPLLHVRVDSADPTR